MRDPRSTTSSWRAGRPIVQPRSAPAPAALAASLVELRAAVTSHAVARRDAGVPLERVLGEMTDLVERAELLERAPDGLAVLLAQVRRWSLCAYLDAPALRNAPLFY